MNTDWEQLEVYADAASAEVVAGLLRSESIPVRIVGREPVPGLAQSFALRVPTSMLKNAHEVLAQAPVGDAELSALALSQNESVQRHE